MTYEIHMLEMIGRYIASHPDDSITFCWDVGSTRKIDIRDYNFNFYKDGIEAERKDGKATTFIRWNALKTVIFSRNGEEKETEYECEN